MAAKLNNNFTSLLVANKFNKNKHTPKAHQADALAKIVASIANGEQGGRLILPTGAGKTAIQAWTIDHMITLGFRKFVVTAPRIALANQLAEEYRKEMKYSARMYGFNSGATPKQAKEFQTQWKEESSTSPKKVGEWIDNASIANAPIIIFSTYHSVHKLNKIMWDGKIADEAQYTVGENFFNSYTSVAATHSFTFTATEKHTASDDGRGLNNITVHGEELYSVAAHTLVKDGIILAPKLHVMKYTDGEGEATVIDEISNFMDVQVDSALNKQGMPYCKVLTATKGSAQLKVINDNYETLTNKFAGFSVATCSSAHGYVIDGEKLTRKEWMDAINEERNIFIFHYDMLAEGIDVQGVSGVVLLRELKQAKLVQTIGRAVRRLKINNVVSELKQYALVSVGVVDGNEDTLAYVSEIIAALRGQGFEMLKAEDIIVTDATRGTEEETSEFELTTGESFPTALFEYITNVEHVIENEKDELEVKTADRATKLAWLA